jgi:hypothetical protein
MLVLLAVVVATTGCVDNRVVATLPPVKDANFQFEAGPLPPLVFPEVSDQGGAGDASPDPGPVDAPDVTPPTDTPVADSSVAWPAPGCTSITGTPSVTFTLDEGKTLALTEIQFTQTLFAAGIVATAVPGLMLASSGGDAIVSTDSGCTWSVLATIGTGVYRLAKGVGGVAWAWTDGGNEVHVVDGEAITVSNASPTTAEQIVGLAASPSNLLSARLVDSTGWIYQTFDGGTSWFSSGTSATVLSAAQVAAFHPTDANKVVVGFDQDGLFYSQDGGGSWLEASGLVEISGGASGVYSAVYSPADPNIVWVMGIDHVQAANFDPSGGEHIYRSQDGGKTFAPVINQNAVVSLSAGMVLAPRPDNSAVLYTVFGPFDLGTDIHRYDHAALELTTEHNPNDGIGAIAFNPSNAGIMYLALLYDDTLR